ncbi:ParA family protein (plasmid) [Entomospira entomophila]|uniref:ParA family protein n=1 Tax=Entomospira entomophila TaxID=2719988 RepID=A0A968GBB9_9SPIO|nr:ParA family protein [Entomospira entomophilus]NIZ41541.1 ParA family protein [Entomospira entomophilus]WDI36431.1 ParA family protein [Entomospira entomophilus]
MMSATVISIVNIKGGVGKSTLAIHLATELEYLGHKTLLVDTDRQRTTREWYDYRVEHKLGKRTPKLMRPVDTYQVGIYDALLRRESENYRYIVVDTAGYESGMMIEIMLASHAVLIPSMVSQAEISSSADTIEKIRGRDIFYRVIWSRIPPTTSQGSRMDECLSMLESEAMKSVIHLRQSYVDAMEQGLVVAEIANDSNQPHHKRKGATVASHEVTSLAREIIGLEE